MAEQLAVRRLPTFRIAAKCQKRFMTGQERALLTLRVGPVARPAILARMFHHAGPHRIQLDVALTRQQIVLLLRQTGAETPLPQASGAAVRAIHILHIALPQRLHQCPRTLGTPGGQQQVHVVGHQDIGVNSAT